VHFAVPGGTVTYQRGEGTVEVELSRVQSWLEIADPVIAKMADRVDSLESYRDINQGSLRIIIWLNGIILALMVGMIVALFTWGLSHISLRVENIPQSEHSALESPQDAGIGKH
jgi:hypothetical protein